jgi:hypothetical protein
MRPLVEVIDMAIKEGLVRSEWSGSLDPDECDCYPLLVIIQGCLRASSTRAVKRREEKDSRRRA